jgi:hypothetical protein
MSAADAQILNQIQCTLQKLIHFIVDNNECSLVAVSLTPQWCTRSSLVRHVILIWCVVTLSHVWVAECHRTIWLQSGYNLANNPAYNHNQTRPYIIWDPGSIIPSTSSLLSITIMIDWRIWDSCATLRGMGLSPGAKLLRPCLFGIIIWDYSDSTVKLE